MKIVIFSDDKFLINYLKKEFLNVFENTENLAYDDVVILDDIDKDTKNLVVINISNKEKNNAINIKKPFRLKELSEKIRNSISYINTNLILFKDGVLDKSKNIFILNSHIIQLTAKEIELVDYLYNHKNSDKVSILKDVWNINNKDNKSLETTIYNIKQKTNNDFIMCNNGTYSLGVK